MDKAPDAFRTISEVAEHLETPAHVLRFWETRFTQVKPVKGAGGRRYYRPADVALLAGIRRLLHNDGMTIRGVQKILRENGVRHVAELGGAEPAAPEPLADLLPPARPEAEVVPLRPPVAAEPARLAPPEEPAPEPDLDTPPPAPTFAPPIPGFGGFGLDLDAPRSGSEGFIAFSDAAQPRPPATATGFVHPEARPKPREEPPRQPTLFDLDAPTDAAIVEEDVEEAPFIHVSDEAPAAAEIAHFAPQPEPEPDSEAEAAVAALLAGISEDESSPVLAEPPPETDAGFVFPGLPDPDPASPAEEPVEAPPALAELAGLVPRLRRLSGVAAEEVLPLADLQARLGLLHAQMVEAQARARRNHGA